MIHKEIWTRGQLLNLKGYFISAKYLCGLSRFNWFNNTKSKCEGTRFNSKVTCKKCLKKIGKK